MNSEMALRKEQIVRTALVILQHDGLEGLTLRKLAAALNIQAASLYWHVKDKKDLLDEIAEVILQEKFPTMPEPKEGQTWQEWLIGVATDLRSAQMKYRDGGKILTGVNQQRAHTYAKLSAHILTTLHEYYGVNILIAGTAMATVLIYTNGSVIEEQSAPNLGEITKNLPALASHLSPRMRETLFSSMPSNVSYDELFKSSLHMILDNAENIRFPES